MNVDANPPKLLEYLLKMIGLEASDLFLRAADRPSFRINGSIHKSDMAPISKKDLEAGIDAILTPVANEHFRRTGDLDFAYSIPHKARFRINLFLHGGDTGLVARLIPFGNVNFENLNLPDSILEMAEVRSGIILVVGPTGCGKSTTLAAILHHINAHRYDHIMTIEDPIEFLHEEKCCLIHQRQVGYDTESFASALKHVVRQSPDVILIGEMRDQDTVQTAMSAALTGHLILSTLHTTNIVQSVDRILNYFPADARLQAQTDLATTLVGLVSMRLLPRHDIAGRIPALEILRGTPTVRRIIVEGKLAELYDIMKRSSDTGMCTLNQSLVSLCNQGFVSPAIALRAASNPDEFRLNLQGMFTGIDSIDMRTEKKSEQEDDYLKG
jgi:twitching motility protein PilT